MDLLAVEEPVNLRSDNVAGIAPEILAAIEAANAGTASSYGADPITARLQDVFAELFETRCFVQPVATSRSPAGSAAGAGIALIAPPPARASSPAALTVVAHPAPGWAHRRARLPRARRARSAPCRRPR